MSNENRTALLQSKDAFEGRAVLNERVNADARDSKGFSEAYAQFFGTPSQPNLATRTTLQVVALANPAFRVEIEATAARSGSRAKVQSHEVSVRITRA